MQKIRKGKLQITVPHGALKRYLDTGWELVSSSPSREEKHTLETPATPAEPELYEGSEGFDEEYEDGVEYVDPEELAKRPLNELDRDELRILAEYKGLDVKEITSTKGLRAALRGLE